MKHDTEAELAETWNVLRAMSFLYRNDPIWGRNYETFSYMNPTQRILWPANLPHRLYN